MIDQKEENIMAELIKTYIKEIYKDKSCSKPEILGYRFERLKQTFAIHWNDIEEDYDEKIALQDLRDVANQNYEETAESASKLSKIHKNMRNSRHKKLIEWIDKELNALAS